MKLGSHAEDVRRILLAEPHPATENDGYAIYCYALCDPETGGFARQFVLTPAWNETHSSYEIAFLGFYWKVFVACPVPPLPASCMLKTNGTLVMPVVNYSDMLAIRDVLSKPQVE